MPKSIATHELDALVAAVGDFSEGAAVAELVRRFPDIPRRSLQRRLSRLLAGGRLRASGTGPARRYHVAGEWSATAGDAPVGPHRVSAPFTDDYVPTTAAGAELRRLMGRPLSQRTPAGYDRTFLDRYIPNQTCYLSRGLRARLHELGHAPVHGRPAGTYARQVLDRLLVDLSWASSRLEGNSYTRLDTQNLIEFGRYAEGKDRLEAQMVLNHKAAIEMLVDGVEDIGFDRYTLLNLHALLAENLLADPAAGGRLRKGSVAITGTVYEPTALPQIIERCFDALLAKADSIADPFEQAFFVMVQLPYLQPFDDVNKRVSRLAANIPLIRGNLAPLSFVNVPETAYLDGTLAVYELGRVELLRDVFTWAYERSCQRYTLTRDALPEPDPLRLRYRDTLGRVVGSVVRDGTAIEPETIRQLVRDEAEPSDMHEFVALAINELSHLKEGNIARYRLRRSEFRAWCRAIGREPR